MIGSRQLLVACEQGKYDSRMGQPGKWATVALIVHNSGKKGERKRQVEGDLACEDWDRGAEGWWVRGSMVGSQAKVFAGKIAVGLAFWGLMAALSVLME